MIIGSDFSLGTGDSSSCQVKSHHINFLNGWRHRHGIQDTSYIQTSLRKVCREVPTSTDGEPTCYPFFTRKACSGLKFFYMAMTVAPCTSCMEFTSWAFADLPVTNKLFCNCGAPDTAENMMPTGDGFPLCMRVS